MFKVSAFLGDTVTQTLSPLADCSVNADESGTVHKSVVLSMVDVTNLATVHSLLQNAPYRVVNRIEIRAVWWPVLRPDEVRRRSRQ